MNYIKLTFEQLTQEEKEIVTAFLDNVNYLGLQDEGENLLVYFNENEQKEIENFQAFLPINYTFTTQLIPHQNWNATWESNFEPIIINNEVGLRAHFHAPFTNVKYDIEITPKMSFGTGHHETTQMMMEYLCETDCSNKTVFDFGCGTGVLAIFTKLKGATHVLGIDNDEWSVENAIENCEKNNCKDIVIKIDSIETIQETFDTIVANINLNILKQYMPKLKQLLAPQGKLFLSGVLVTDEQEITQHICQTGLKVVSTKKKNKWMALLIHN